MPLLARGSRGTRGFSTFGLRDFSKGMFPDLPKNAVPDGGCFTATDFLLHRAGRIAGRSGGSQTNLNAAAANHYPVAANYAIFAAGAQLVSVTDDGKLNLVGSTLTLLKDMGAAWATLQNPVLSIIGGNQNLVVTANDGTSAPYTYVGSGTPAALGGSPPAGKYSCIHLSRLVLANTAANPNRLWFSPVPNIASTWDTSNAYIDCDAPIVGLSSVNGALIVFCSDHSEKIIGDIPPGSPGSNMSRTRIGNIGCVDARSICVFQNKAVFYSTKGVYLTDGSSFRSLSANKVDGASSPTSSRVVAGIYNDEFLIVSFTTAGTLDISNLVCYLPTEAWWAQSKPAAMCMASRSAGGSALYVGVMSQVNMENGANYFKITGASTYESDGSTVIAPTLSTGLLSGDTTGLKAFGHGHVSYRASGPTLAVNVTRNINGNAAAVAESPLSGSFDGRKRFAINADAQGVQITLTQASTVGTIPTSIYGIEYEARSYYPNADGP